MVRFNDYTFGRNNFLQDEGDDFIDNRGSDNLNRGDGGTGNSNAGSGVRISQNEYIFSIKANVKGAGVKYNGGFIGSVPKELRISKADLIEKGDRIIEIGKVGYTSNEKYVVSLKTNGATIQRSSIFRGGFGGISQTEIIVKYYVNGREVAFANKNSNYINLPFKLVRDGNVKIDDKTKRELTISLSGVRGGNPIVLRKNGYRGTDIFPQLGKSTYEDKVNTNYKVKSADVSLYRITKISYNGKLINEAPLIANDDESLSADIKLGSDISINIETTRIPPIKPIIKPIVELLSNASRLYNINTEIGVPLAFKKNESVKAITIVVGDDILEFDDLDDGDVAGITIPHSTFQKIGKYNIKIFPFSLNDYDDNIQKPKTIKIKPIKIKPIPEVIIEDIKPPNIKPIGTIDINPYKQNNINTNYLSNINLGGFKLYNQPGMDSRFVQTNMNMI